MSTKRLRTPLIKPRTQGGTFYTFSSALEDIGLNINELRNKVALSHYVVLDIPPFNFEGMEQYGTDEDNYNQGDYKFAESLQNYALNMETVLRNQDTYNFSESLTVSERVFWKYLKTIGLIKFEKDSSALVDNPYYIETSDIVKGFGLINAGAQRTDAYGIYNETFVQIPSSYGRMKVLFKPVADKNYHILDDNESYMSTNTEGLLENLDKNDYDASTNILYTGISANAQYDGNYGDRGIYEVLDPDDELCVEFSLDKLREYYGKETLTYDDMGIECIGMDKGENNSSYKFNAILVYYSIYDSTSKNVLATNLYGILILNSAVPYQDVNTIDSGNYYVFPQLEKKQTTATVSGSSYAFRLNVKASSIYSGNVIVNDESTASFEMSTEFNDVLRNLTVAIETLKSNANVISTIVSDNKALKTFAASTIDKVNNLEKDILTLKKGVAKNVIAGTITSDSVSTNNIIIPEKGTFIYTKDDNVGSLGKDTLYYKNIQARGISSDNASINNIHTSTLTSDNGELLFMDGNDTCGKVTTNGLFTNNSLYIKNNQGAPNNALLPQRDVELILNNAGVYLDSSINYYLTLPSADEYGISQSVLKSLYEKTNGVNAEGFDYYNLSSLVMLLLQGYKILNNKLKALDPSTYNPAPQDPSGNIGTQGYQGTQGSQGTQGNEGH